MFDGIFGFGGTVLAKIVSEDEVYPYWALGTRVSRSLCTDFLCGISCQTRIDC
jgi:hypothetical protein